MNLFLLIMAVSGQRSFHVSPHHFCSRCGREFLLSQLTWQEGHLRCPDDVDKMVKGDRETMIAATLAKPSKELAPDDKLVEPSAGQITDTIHFTI